MTAQAKRQPDDQLNRVCLPRKQQYSCDICITVGLACHRLKWRRKHGVRVTASDTDASLTHIDAETHS